MQFIGTIGDHEPVPVFSTAINIELGVVTLLPAVLIF